MAPREAPPGRWQFWIDRGGTFTDVVGRSPEGRLVTAKLLSDNPEHYSDAALAGIRRVLGVAMDEPMPVDRIEVVKLGTTVSTNALLERKGEPTVLVPSVRTTSTPRPRWSMRPCSTYFARSWTATSP